MREGYSQEISTLESQGADSQRKQNQIHTVGMKETGRATEWLLIWASYWILENNINCLLGPSYGFVDWAGHNQA